MRSGKGPPLPVLALAASRIQHVFGSSCWIQSSYGKHSSLPDIISFLKFLLPLTGTNDMFIMLDQRSNQVPHFDRSSSIVSIEVVSGRFKKLLCGFAKCDLLKKHARCISFCPLMFPKLIDPSKR